MKIGIEAQRLFRTDKHGMEIVTQELIRHLQLLDTENEYVLFIKQDQGATIRETENFRIHYLGGSYPVWEQFRLPKAAKSEKIDFLHCTSNTGPLYLKVPVMLTLHDIIYLEQVEFTGSPYQNFGNLYRRAVVPGLLKHCRYILTVSEYEKQVIQERLPSVADRVHVVYNGVNPAFQVIKDNRALDYVRNKYKLPTRFLLAFGNTAPKKNTGRLLLAYAEAFKTDASLPALVLTDYTQEMMFTVLQGPLLKQVRKQVFVLGHVPHTDIPALYNLAEIFIYPSLRESFGMPVLEAMACGIPVITSSTSSMPEVAGGAAELIDPFNTDSIAGAILKLMASSQLRNERILMGLKRSSTFSWKNTAASVLSFYEKMYRD